MNFSDDVFSFPTFQVEVTGAILTATVLAISSNPVEHGFQLYFSDGHQEWFNLLEQGWRGTHGLVGPHLSAIHQDLDIFTLRGFRQPLYYWRLAIDGAIANVWVIAKCGEAATPVFSIYYRGDFQFSLALRQEEWYSFSVRKVAAQPIDGAVVREIVSRLNRMLKLGEHATPERVKTSLWRG